MTFRHTTVSAAGEHHSPDFSVSVETDGGWICVAEFRTQQEAMMLAESAVERSRLHTRIRRNGQTIADMEATPTRAPEAAAAGMTIQAKIHGLTNH